MTPAATGPAGRAPAGPQECPGFLLWRTTLHWQRCLTAALRPLELTHVQFVLLAAVWWLAGPPGASPPGQQGRAPSQRQVAEHAGTDVMMTSQVLRTLEKRGLVTRTPDHADTRIKRLAVTQAGQHLAERAITVAEAADTQFFAQARDPAQLLAILHQLAGYPSPGGDATGQRRQDSLSPGQLRTGPATAGTDPQATHPETATSAERT